MRKHRTKASNSGSGLAQTLGWFSMALGAVELLAPGTLARILGVRERSGLFRLLGLREMASGAGLLTRPRPVGWLWSRVAGDAMDLALLGAALAGTRRNQSRLVAATAAVAGVTLLDILASRQQSRNGPVAGEEDEGRNIHVRKTTIIERPPEELYQFWRNFENLPRFMNHLDSVQVTSPTRSRWLAKGPAGVKVDWEAEITEDRPNELIAWRSLPGEDFETIGQVRFTKAPGGRGTMVSVEMDYKTRGGPIGAVIARFFRAEPAQQVHDGLRFFKQLMETGVISTTEGQPAGRKSSTSKKFDYKVPGSDLVDRPA